jgi:hypothetical protein
MDDGGRPELGRRAREQEREERALREDGHTDGRQG